MTDELRADPINDDVIEMDEDTRKSSAFREAFPDDTEPRGWAEHYFEVGYEAGRRAERERIAKELLRISDTSDSFDTHSMRVETFMVKLEQADPAESGE